MINPTLSIDINLARDQSAIYSQYIKLIKNNSLASVYPEIAKEWNNERNGLLTPGMVSFSSAKKVWWKCSSGHEWQSPVTNRTNKSQKRGCPVCGNKVIVAGENDLATTNPDIVNEWNYERNTIAPNQISNGSSNKVWWRCNKGHEWQAAVYSRVKGNGCPICNNTYLLKGYNDLATVNPQIAKEWHPTKNGNFRPSDILYGSKRKIWWICEKGHEWQADLSSRIFARSNCPICSGLVFKVGVNDLATKNPRLVNEWNHERNDPLKPEMFRTSSTKKVWWTCSSCGYEWQSSIKKRNEKSGCPACAGVAVWLGHNDLATMQPDAASEWHPFKNGDKKPENYVAGSNANVWWQCKKCGHEWETLIVRRSSGSKCPSCYKRKKPQMKSVEQLDISSSEIFNEFESAVEAEKITKISHKAISACCNGKKKNAGGYIWRFKNDSSS